MKVDTWITLPDWQWPRRYGHSHRQYPRYRSTVRNGEWKIR